MGRTKKQTRNQDTFLFLGKPVKAYQPASGQAAVVAMAVEQSEKMGAGKAFLRLFTILEKLIVDPARWEWIDGTFVDGTASIEDLSNLLGEIFGHEWPEPDSGETAEGE